MPIVNKISSKENIEYLDKSCPNTPLIFLKKNEDTVNEIDLSSNKDENSCQTKSRNKELRKMSLIKSEKKSILLRQVIKSYLGN